MLPTVSILIVAYNSCAILPACLDAVAAETRLPYEIIVVDNASQDDTVSLVRTRYPQITLIENRRNVGFAAAVNQAGRVAGGCYLLLLNPDTVVQTKAVDRLVEFMNNHTGVGIAAPYVIDEYNQPAPNSQEFHTAVSLFWRTQFGGPLNWLARRMFAGYVARQNGVEAVYGCALLIRADLYRNLGGLDERFFMYEEDIDLCYRVLQSGFAVVRVPDIFIVHCGGQSSTLPDTTPEQKKMGAFAQRLHSRSLYACKHFSPSGVWLLHFGYTITGAGFLLFGMFKLDQQSRNRRLTIGRHYLQVGLRGLR